MTRLLAYFHHHALALTALVVAILALASASYAAFTINGRQIQNHTIQPVKFDPRFIAGSVRAWAVVAPNGRVIAGRGGPRVSKGSLPGQYTLDWSAYVTHRCATEATIDEIASESTTPLTGPSGTASSVAGYASAATFSFYSHRVHRRTGRTIVQAFNGQGQPAALGIDVTVLC